MQVIWCHRSDDSTINSALKFEVSVPLRQLMMWRPFGVADTNTATWEPAPTRRGTLDLLSSCILTLVLCVYSCLHLNIPELGKTHWSQKLKKQSLWVLAGTFTPEIVLFVALQQRVAAGQLERKMNKAFFPTQSSDTLDAVEMTEPMIPVGNKKRISWTKLHSHYALMGGFVLDCSACTPGTIPGQRTHFTLTAAGLLKLAENEPDMIPNLGVEHIEDKSNADSLAKIIVCVQAVWFSVQIIGRLSTGYALSLLEISTFAHALCCLAVYGCWWNKPMSIDTPTLIDCSDKRAEKILSWLFMASWAGASHRLCMTERGRIVQEELIGLLIYRPDKKFGTTERNTRLHGVPSSVLDVSTQDIHLAPMEGIHGFYFITVPNLDCYNPWNRTRFMALSPADVQFLKQAHSLIEGESNWSIPYDIRSRTFSKKMLPRMEKYFGKYSDTRPEPVHDYLSAYAPNLPRGSDRLIDSAPLGNWDFAQERFDQLLFRFNVAKLSTGIQYLLFACSTSIGIVYGALHLIAWHAPFTSKIQSVLWRASSIFVTIYVPIVSLTIFCMPMLTKGEFGSVSYIVFSTLFLLLCIVYSIFFVFARVYLVLECFISLPYLPTEVYEQPQWSRYTPHFGAG